MWFNIIANLRYLQYYSRMEELGQHYTQNKYTLFVYVVKYTLLSYSVAMTVNHKTANTIYSSHFPGAQITYGLEYIILFEKWPPQTTQRRTIWPSIH